MQTAVNTRMPIGIPGQLADLHTTEFGDTVSVTNTEASAEIAFGLMVKNGTTQDSALLVAAAADADDLVGIAVHANNFAYPEQIGDTGLKPGTTFAALRKGRIFVIAVDAVTPDDEVHMRHSGTGVKGSFQKTAVAGETLDLTGFAKWNTSAGVGEVAILEIDMTNSSLATADV